MTRPLRTARRSPSEGPGYTSLGLAVSNTSAATRVHATSRYVGASHRMYVRMRKVVSCVLLDLAVFVPAPCCAAERLLDDALVMMRSS